MHESFHFHNKTPNTSDHPPRPEAQPLGMILRKYFIRDAHEDPLKLVRDQKLLTILETAEDRRR